MIRSPGSKGFTLIELLIVIVMIGGLAGVGISLLNPARQQGRARDGVRLTRVKSLAEAIQSYRQLEGSYPLVSDTSDPDSTLRQVYIRDWPAPQADDGSLDPDNWSYMYNTDGDRFLVYSPNSLGECYKFQSDWSKLYTCPLLECTTEFTDSANCD